MSTSNVSQTNPNMKFFFGIVLIICGWVICFDVFKLMIGMAFFLLGTILVLVSKKSLLVKLITIGIPILLWFVCFEIILHEIGKQKKVTLLDLKIEQTQKLPSLEKVYVLNYKTAREDRVLIPLS